MDGGRRNAQNEDNQQTDLLCHDNDDDGVHDDDDELGNLILNPKQLDTRYIFLIIAVSIIKVWDFFNFVLNEARGELVCCTKNEFL